MTEQDRYIQRLQQLVALQASKIDIQLAKLDIQAAKIEFLTDRIAELETSLQTNEGGKR